jgi:hypothetical protein
LSALGSIVPGKCRCLGLVVMVVCVIRKYETKRRQFKDDLKEPGMKSVK